MKNKQVIVILIMLIWGYVGCAVYGPIDGKKLSAIKEGRMSLVLLKVTCDIAGEPALDPSPGCIRGENASVAIGGFDMPFGGVMRPEQTDAVDHAGK